MISPLILVVDDDQATATFLDTLLVNEGYEVLKATGETALRLARERPPALVLLDRRMPDVDGPELARRLRADPRTATIPLVLMSADARFPEGMEGVVDDWLAKPFHLTALFDILVRWAPLPGEESPLLTN